MRCPFSMQLDSTRGLPRQAPVAFWPKLGRSLFAVPILSALLVSAQTPTPPRLFAEAVAAQQRGDDATAVLKYRELLKTHPGSVEARVNLGAALAQMGRFDEAIEQYRSVLAAGAGNAQLQLNLALAYRRKGDIVQTVEVLEALRKAQPGDRQSALLLADCYIQQERFPEVIALLTPRAAAQPGDLELAWLLGLAELHGGRERQGLARIEQVALRGANAEAYLLAGETRLARTEYDLAQRNADAAQRLNPVLPGLRTLQGMILEHTGNFRSAAECFRQALAADRDDFNANYYLGAILYFDRELGPARSHLERALQLRPGSAEVRLQLALVARQQGRLDDALKDLTEASRQTPSWLAPHVELAALYYALDRAAEGDRERVIVDRLMAEHQRNAPGPRR